MPAKQRVCAYCAKTGTKREGNREHFVPRGVWGGGRPNRTLTVWAHTECNSSYSQDDEYFRDALIFMNGSQEHPEAQRVLAGPLSRVMDERPTVFINHLRAISPAEVRTHSGLFAGHSLAFPLDMPRFYRVLRKIVLGLYFCKFGKPLPPDHAVLLAWDNRQTSAVMSDIFPYMQPIEDFGDDVFRYTWFAQPSDDRLTFWWLGFYEAFGFFAVTRPIRRELGEVQSYQGVSHSNAWTQVLA
jgi:hypothetical protein